MLASGAGGWQGWAAPYPSSLATMRRENFSRALSRGQGTPVTKTGAGGFDFQNGEKEPRTRRSSAAFFISGEVYGRTTTRSNRARGCDTGRSTKPGGAAQKRGTAQKARRSHEGEATEICEGKG